MANHAILIQNAVMAKDVDSLNRSVVATADIDNGNVFQLGAYSTTAGEEQVFAVAQAATANGLKFSMKLLGTTHISIPDGTIGTQRVTAYKFEVTDNSSNFWMAAEPEVVLTASKYKGIDPDVRNFYNATGDVFTAFKPQVGDIVTLTAEALSGTKGSNTFVVAANGAYTLAWAATANA